MKKTATSHDAILREIRASDFQKVKVAITDVDGVLRGKYLHKDKFLGAVDSGFGFCSVIFGWDSSDLCYDHVDFTGWHNGYPDALAQIDLGTYRKIPWEGDIPFFLGDFIDPKGAPLPVCPRQLLKKVIARSTKLGFEPSFGMEFEWFNFREDAESLRANGFASPTTLTPGMFGYSLLRMAQNEPFFRAIMDELLAFRIPVEGLHTETGPGVLEAAILYSGALEAADRAVLFKGSVKEIGHRFGILPTFMAKWNEKLPGCSGHMHQSLADRKGDNAFFAEKDPAKMSETFKHYVAGQIQLMPELLAFFAPTINSYKRLVEGAWAPTKANWGIDNRTTALRVISGSKKSTRLETRVSGSDVNPYLSIAAALASGLYGIEHKIALKSKPIAGNGYRDEVSKRLPRTLEEAAEQLHQSKIARELFGDAFVDHYAKTRLWEWRQFQTAVTTWERERYFEII